MDESKTVVVQRTGETATCSPWMIRRVQVSLAVCVSIALLYEATSLLLTRQTSTQRSVQTLRFDLNDADRVELQLLPKIGPTMAKRIIDHRNRFGPFRSVDQLESVSGVGPITMSALRPYLLVSDRFERITGERSRSQNVDDLAVYP